MTPAAMIILVVGLGLAGFLFGRARAWTFRARAGGRALVARPDYHGWYAALWIGVPTLVVYWIWSAFVGDLMLAQVLASPEAQMLPEDSLRREVILMQAYDIATGSEGRVLNEESYALAEPYRAAIRRFSLISAVLCAIVAAIGAAIAFLRLRPEFTARTRVERTVLTSLLLASLVAILTTLGIFLTLVFETVQFFTMVSPADFLFGTQWSPDVSSDPGSIDGSRYGAVPLFWGTLFIGAFIAMLVAIPLGMMSAIYLTQYANPTLRRWVKPTLEILAGVPTVVYGYFAALTISPAIRNIALSLGVSNPSSESALAAGLVMGVMIIPFVSSMADDSIAAVPVEMRDGSLAVGATTYETIKHVLIPAALPGIIGGVMLAISRAIGETMIVVMAASTAANLSANPLESMTTVTVQIVALLTGEGSFSHPSTLAAFALGFVLFMVTLALNFVALRVVKRFREAYD